MSTPDTFEHDDASFVLGLLEREERLEFEAHLLVCDACRGRVERLRGTAALLADLGPDDIDTAAPGPVPDTSLPALLRRAGVARRRRRTAFTTLGVTAAAAVVALVVGLWPAGPAARPAVGTAAGAPQRMAALTSTSLTATARLASSRGSTQISLTCRYATGGYPAAVSGTYLLSVLDTSGNRHELGSWTLRPGADTRFSSGVAVPRTAIRQVLVTTPDHRPVLRLNE